MAETENYKNYWKVFIIIASIGSTFNVIFSVTYSVVVDLLLGIISFMLISVLIGALVFFMSYIVNRKLTYLFFIKTSIVVCLILAFSHFINLLW